MSLNKTFACKRLLTGLLSGSPFWLDCADTNEVRLLQRKLGKKLNIMFVKLGATTDVKATQPYSYLYHFATVVSTAFSTVDLKPPSSSAATPQIVVPPGLETSSFTMAGCLCVS